MPWRCIGGIEVYVQSFLILATDGGEWTWLHILLHCICGCSQRYKRWYFHWKWLCVKTIPWHSLLSRSSAVLRLMRCPAKHHLFIEHALHRLVMQCVLTATGNVSSSFCPLSSKLAHVVNTFWYVFGKCLVQNLIGISANFTEFLVRFHT